MAHDVEQKTNGAHVDGEGCVNGSSRGAQQVSSTLLQNQQVHQQPQRMLGAGQSTQMNQFKENSQAAYPHSYEPPANQPKNSRDRTSSEQQQQQQVIDMLGDEIGRVELLKMQHLQKLQELLQQRTQPSQQLPQHLRQQLAPQPQSLWALRPPQAAEANLAHQGNADQRGLIRGHLGALDQQTAEFQQNQKMQDMLLLAQQQQFQQQSQMLGRPADGQSPTQRAWTNDEVMTNSWSQGAEHSLLPFYMGPVEAMKGPLVPKCPMPDVTEGSKRWPRRQYMNECLATGSFDCRGVAPFMPYSKMDLSGGTVNAPTQKIRQSRSAATKGAGKGGYRSAGTEDMGNPPGGDTMKAQLQALREEDHDAIFIARHINKIGFSSAEVLRTHFGRYGQVKDVLVAHSRVKVLRHTGSGHASLSRLRPAGLGFIVMSSAADAKTILADGPEHVVNGVTVQVQAFHHQDTSPSADDSQQDQSLTAEAQEAEPYFPVDLPCKGLDRYAKQGAQQRWHSPGSDTSNY
jgi:hypothetical protein